MPLLRRTFLYIVLSLLASDSIAQGNRFLYLQTDDGQPFYVKAGGVHHSSTLSGFLILSRLKDTAIDLVLGFPRDMYPPQNFRVSGLDRDRGMVVKRREDGGWEMVDLQTMEVTAASEVVKDPPMPRQPLQPAISDSFTTMLSTVISDSTLLESKASTDRDAGRTVAVVRSPVSDSSSPAIPSASTNRPDTLKTPVASSREPLPVAVLAVQDSTNAPDVGKVQTGETVRADRTDCRSSQSVKQLGDLRRRMESLRDEEAKVAEAVREMRLRCFTTEQVRSLLVVFDREEGRFKMLNAGYPFVQDPSSYPSLLPVLKDPYFIHRFKRLTGMPVE